MLLIRTDFMNTLQSFPFACRSSPKNESISLGSEQKEDCQSMLLLVTFKDMLSHGRFFVCERNKQHTIPSLLMINPCHKSSEDDIGGLLPFRGGEEKGKTEIN